MTGPLDLNTMRGVYGAQAAELAATITRPEAVSRPNPRHYDLGSKYLSLYFDYFAAGASAAEDEAFYTVIDGTTSTVLSLYLRDSYTRRQTVGRPIGTSPTDLQLENGVAALQNVLMDLCEDPRTSEQVRFATGRVGDVAAELVRKRRSGENPDTDQSRRSLRARAAGALTEVRYLRDYPQVYDRLTVVGNHAALAIFGLSSVVRRHERDIETVALPDPETGEMVEKTRDVPQYRDSIAHDIAAALRAAYQTD